MTKKIVGKEAFEFGPAVEFEAMHVAQELKNIFEYRLKRAGDMKNGATREDKMFIYNTFLDATLGMTVLLATTWGNLSPELEAGMIEGVKQKFAHLRQLMLSGVPSEDQGKAGLNVVS